MDNLFIFFFLLSFGVTSVAVTTGPSVKYVDCFVHPTSREGQSVWDYGKYIPYITIEVCKQECIDFYTNSSQILYFGMNDGSMCYCEEVEFNYGRYGPSKDCTLTCGGNETQICGGHQAISVYQISPSPCGPLISPSNGFVKLIYNNTASFSCFNGYHLQGSRCIRCNLSTLEWDIPREPSCTKKGKCEKLENPLNGKVHQNGNQANFSCDRSHILDGESVLICLSTGNWSTEPPDCIPQHSVHDLTTVFGTVFEMTSETNEPSEVLGLPIHIFTSLLLVAVAVLVIVIIILVNCIVKTTTETKRIRRFKTDSTCVEQRSQCQETSESYWKSPPDLLKTSKGPDTHL